MKAQNNVQPLLSASRFYVVIIQPKIDKNHTRLVFGYTTAVKFEEKDLIRLGKRLRNQFANDSKVSAFFFNNKDDATLYGKKLIDYPTKENLRVTYLKDKNGKEEYIEYSPDAANPAKTIKLKLKH
jgi:hypothetical protein